MKRYDFTERQRECLKAISEAASPFGDEYVIAIEVTFIPVTAEANVECECVHAKATIGSFRRGKTS